MNPLNTSGPTYKPDPVSLNQAEDVEQPKATAKASPIVEPERKSLHEYDVRKKDNSNVEQSRLREPVSINQANK